jgi:predicted phosphodiesterase
MNIITISDTHNKHVIPSKYIDNVDGEFDMIIHAGDISSTGSKNEIRVFFNWYSKLPYKYIILIAGNHDFL